MDTIYVHTKGNLKYKDAILFIRVEKGPKSPTHAGNREKEGDWNYLMTLTHLLTMGDQYLAFKNSNSMSFDAKSVENQNGFEAAT